VTGPDGKPVNVTSTLYKIWVRVPALGRGLVLEVDQGCELILRAGGLQEFEIDEHILNFFIVDGMLVSSHAATSLLTEIYLTLPPPSY
jgi:hypothetical protein